MTDTMLPLYNVSRHAHEGGFAVIVKYGADFVAGRARRGLAAKWAREIDPLGTLDPRELARRLEARQQQHMAMMTNKSAIARAARKKSGIPTRYSR